MYYAGVLFKNGGTTGKACATKEEAENYILELAEKEEIKQCRIRKLSTGEEEVINFEEEKENE